MKRGSAEYKEHLRERMQRLWKDPKFVEKIRSVNSERMRRPEYRSHMQYMVQRSLYLRKHDPAIRAIMSETGRKNMAKVNASPATCRARTECLAKANAATQRQVEALATELVEDWDKVVALYEEVDTEAIVDWFGVHRATAGKVAKRAQQLRLASDTDHG